MPKGPQGQMRPADAIGCAVMVGMIATGEFLEDKAPPKKSRASGGLARSERLTSARRSEIAKSAANARWAEKEGVE